MSIIQLYFYVGFGFVKQGLASFSGKGPDTKYFRLGGSHGLCYKFLTSQVILKQEKVETGSISQDHSSSTTLTIFSNGEELSQDGRSHISVSLSIRHRARTSAQFHQQSSLNQCSRIQMTQQFRKILSRQVCYTFFLFMSQLERKFTLEKFMIGKEKYFS